MADKDDKGLTRIGDLLPKIVSVAKYKPPSAIQERLLSMPMQDPEDVSILYQHSVLCQTSMPYRDPGAEVRIWQRRNGFIRLELQAGRVLDPATDDFVDVGLPFGPKPRLVLYHLNAESLRTQSPLIELEDSLTAFVRRTLRLAPKGQNITMVKEQLKRLAASSIRIGTRDDANHTAHTDKLEIVKGFNLWFPKDDRQRVLWPTYVDLSPDYFESLLNRAVPLAEHHIAALSHSGLALDIYAWLAQRLHRISPAKPAFVTWTALHAQFGQGYTGPQAVKKFRSAFREALKQVLTLYKAARITDDRPHRPSLFIEDGAPVWKQPPAEGLTLRHSPPPVARRLISISGPKSSTTTLVRQEENPVKP